MDIKLGRKLGWGSGELFKGMFVLFVMFKCLYGEGIFIIFR